MKTNHRLIVKLVSLALLILLVGVFTQCVATNTDQIGGNSASNNYSSGPTVIPPKDEGQIINSTEVNEGIKSYEQILYTMSALTSVPVATVKNAYDQLTTSLPTDNDIKVFLPAHQLAITKLAAEFCSSLVDNTTLRVNVWPTYNAFGTTPARGSFTPQNRTVLIQELIQSFWGGVITENELYAAEAELDQLITTLLVGESTTDPVTTRNVIKGVCTVALSSAHVTLL